MEHFEFDPSKSETNLERHGIDFIQAQELWDETHVIISATKVRNEERHFILGKINGKIYAAVFAKRSERIRLISCHRADKRLVRIYEAYTQKQKKS